MKKNIDCINFDNIDLSEFNSEINRIHQEIEDLKKNKKIMKKLQKIKLDSQKKVYDVTYNDKEESVEKFDKLTKKVVIEKKSYNNSYSSSYSPSLYS